MENRDILTVKEFAEIAGVTVQAVYPRLEKDLAEYVRIINGKKFIDKRALEPLGLKEAPEPQAGAPDEASKKWREIKEENDRLKIENDLLRAEIQKADDRENKLYQTILGQGEALKQQGLALTQAQQLQARTILQLEEAKTQLQQAQEPEPPKQKKGLFKKRRNRGK